MSVGVWINKKRIDEHFIAEDKLENRLLLEIAYEVCNQLGGIYTVLRTKAETMVNKWGDSYYAIGPYFSELANYEFSPVEEDGSVVFQAIKNLRSQGFNVHYGVWEVTGGPKVILFDIDSIMGRLNEIKYYMWRDHHIDCPSYHPVVDKVLAFGEVVHLFIEELSRLNPSKEILAHFHEWMAGTSIPRIRKKSLNIKIIFTTHATILGRYLAVDKYPFYSALGDIDPDFEASKYNIVAESKIERAAAHGAHIFTTVSDVTAKEAEYLIGRKPEYILPNGINSLRFEAVHEFQNLHKLYKDKISDFVISHFFPSYSFDLDKTLYFFTSGRYEYQNKGFDLTLDAAAKLNYLMKKNKSDKTVVLFLITKRPYTTINSRTFHFKTILENIRSVCKDIEQELGHQLFLETVKEKNSTQFPDLQNLVTPYLKLHYRKMISSWNAHDLPPIVTHNLTDPRDEVVKYLDTASLLNFKEDKVKIVYYPDFINPVGPMGMEYDQFVRGCHLGIFPSYYEPWGYTPLECLARGVPAATSNLAGFGDYVMKNMKKPEDEGIYIVDRTKHNFQYEASELAQKLYQFTLMSRRERIDQRNRAERASYKFDWKSLGRYYEKAYQEAFKTSKSK